MALIKYCATILFSIFLTSCCEPAHIDLLLLCDQELAELSDPPTCRNNSVIPSKNKAFTVSIDSYSIRNDRNIRFSLYDGTNDNEIIKEVTGPLSEFGSPYTSTERCVSYMTHTFNLPKEGLWPDKLLIEVVVTDGDSIYELTHEFSPI